MQRPDSRHQPDLFRRGFTIVELLIVIVVIGILAAVVIVAYNGISSRATVASLQSSLAQANKKLELYAAENSAYPTDLATFQSLMGTTGSTSFQYSVNNSASPKTYCVTATTGTTSYNSSSSAQTATSGGCPGHGVGGVAPVTNWALNPGTEAGALSLSGMGGVGTDSTIVSSTSWADTGSRSILVTKSVSAGTPQGVKLAVGMPALVVGDVVRWAASVRNNTTTQKSFVLYGERSSPSYQGLTGSSVISIAAGAAVRLTGSATVGSNFVGTPVGFGVLPWSSSFAVGESYSVDSFVVTLNENLPAGYVDGSSPGWIWNGTANNSTSTGPPL